MNQSDLKIGVIGQCRDGATFQTKAETARFSRLRRRQRAFLDQGGDGATFLTLISIAALTFVGSQNCLYSQCNRNTHNEIDFKNITGSFYILVFLVFSL